MIFLEPFIRSKKLPWQQANDESGAWIREAKNPPTEIQAIWGVAGRTPGSYQTGFFVLPLNLPRRNKTYPHEINK